MNRGADGQPTRVQGKIRGAWFVETFVVALVLLLVGKMLDIAITIPAFLGASAIAVVIMLCVELVRVRIERNK